MSEDMRDAEGTLMTAIERALHEADDCRAQWPLHPHMWHRISFPTEEMRLLLDAARAELAQHAALAAAGREYASASAVANRLWRERSGSDNGYLDAHQRQLRAERALLLAATATPRAADPE